jgi:integrase
MRATRSDHPALEDRERRDGRPADGLSSAEGNVVERPVVVNELRVHLDAYVAPDPHALVFTPATGRYLRRADLSTAWRAACDRLGLERGLRPHDLRHHTATVAARMPGLTRRELVMLLGHASERAAVVVRGDGTTTYI